MICKSGNLLCMHRLMLPMKASIQRLLWDMECLKISMDDLDDLADGMFVYL